MRHWHLVLWSAAVVLAAGCSQPIQVYKSISSMGEAGQEADLVVEGRVAASDDIENYPIGDVWSNIFGKLGQECAVKTRITFEVTRVIKGPAGDLNRPVAFWFYAPCFHAEPDVLMGVSLPPVLVKGDRLRVYLRQSGDQYWLIAHERIAG